MALENFDTIGRWRDKEKISPDKLEPIIVEGTLPDDKKFKDFDSFQSSLLKHEEDVAQHMIESLIVYALGRDIEFTDAPHIQKIMNDLRPTKFRMKDMIQAVAESPLFIKN